MIYDDMIVSGGTVARAARAARTAGARRILVAATHAAFTPAAMQLFASDGPDHVLVSDSIDLTVDFAALASTRLRVCSMAPALAACLRDSR